MAGRFITFEGGEGAGKSTQIRHLADRLAKAGISAVTTREPGGTPTAESIRRLLLGGFAKELGPEGEAMLFAAARADHVENKIRPALESGQWVLCDRFTDSTNVYQGMTGGVPAELLRALERVSVGATRPDLTLILDVPVDVGMARAAARIAGGSADRFESEDLSVQEARRQAYLDIARREPERCVVIDGMESETAMADAIWTTVETRLLAQVP
jgi:dTMP kinase